MKYTKELLESEAANACSVSDLIRRLGRTPTGSAHRYMSSRLQLFGIDTSHFTQKYPPRRKLSSDVLSVNRIGRRESTKLLRKALINAGLSYICSECNIGNVWNNRNLVLQIDHINGNGLDNRKENLRFLCPNCHSQTHTFGSKNAVYTNKSLSAKPTKKIKKSKILKASKRPSKEELELLIFTMPATHIGKKYGVTDKAVEKWCKYYNISKPPRGYWTKRKISV